jgi:hypothetical protein
LSQTLELVFNNHVGNISIGNPVLIWNWLCNWWN